MGRQPKSHLTPFPPLPDERIVHFALEGLLPPTQVLALHLALRILTRLAHGRHRLHPLILGEQQFSRKELNLLYPLLVNYPAHTPHEVLYASLRYGYARLSERVIERARTHLSEVQAIPGLWGAETHPIHNTLSRARAKLHELGLDTVLLVEVGYVLDTYQLNPA